ncbi:MAG: hypothetical protein R3B96_15105 [Pirellulaceae bacterium]
MGLALSFFLMWNFSGSGQPSNMVRLLAFKDSRTLQRAIFTMAVYYGLIYFPLVMIFVMARVLLPGWEVESDRIMPEVASHVTALAGVPWLAGLLLAAPFAAVMSTMDSFLLVNASAITRDLYHRNINRRASEQRLKTISIGSTIVIGVVAMVLALNPPKYLPGSRRLYDEWHVDLFSGSGVPRLVLATIQSRGRVRQLDRRFSWPTTSCS